MKNGKAETFEEWIALGKEMFKDDDDIVFIQGKDNIVKALQTINDGGVQNDRTNLR